MTVGSVCHACVVTRNLGRRLTFLYLLAHPSRSRAALCARARSTPLMPLFFPSESCTIEAQAHAASPLLPEDDYAGDGGLSMTMQMHRQSGGEWRGLPPHRPAMWYATVPASDALPAFSESRADAVPALPRYRQCLAATSRMARY
jgi:hypothetical protein